MNNSNPPIGMFSAGIAAAILSTIASLRRWQTLHVSGKRRRIVVRKTTPSARDNITRRVAVGVCGSVAAVKAPQIVEGLVQAGCYVDLIFTRAGSFFMDVEYKGSTPRELLRRLERRRDRDGVPLVRSWTDSDEWTKYKAVGDDVVHINLARRNKVFLIAPLDANTLGNLALGLSSNLLTCVAKSWRYRDREPSFVIAPAMNTVMWQQTSTTDHVKKLVHAMKARVVPPQKKRLACGDYGVGAMARVEDVVRETLSCLESHVSVDEGKAETPHNAVLVMVAKYPKIGRSKTRLSKSVLGPDRALAFAHASIEDTLYRLGSGSSGIRKVLYYAPSDAKERFQQTCNDVCGKGVWELMPMATSEEALRGSGLTSILRHALCRCKDMFGEDVSVTFVGMDAPLLNTKDVLDAVRSSVTHSVANIFPANDGGYVLLSLPPGAPNTVFDDVEWSTASTLRSQVAQLTRCQVRVRESKHTFLDVDELDDLIELARILRLAGVGDDESAHVESRTARYQRGCPKTVSLLRRWIDQDGQRLWASGGKG